MLKQMNRLTTASLFIVLILPVLYSCSYFLSPYDGPIEVSHGFVEGVTPSGSGSFEKRTYPTVKADWPGPGGDKLWLAVNLGASFPPQTSVDRNAGSAGWYFQFNRKQAYHHNGEALVPRWETTSIEEDSEWKLENDPCHLLLGDSWRIPTVEMLRAFREAPVSRGGMGEGNRTSAFNSELRLHAAGNLHSFTGELQGRGETGNYWARDQVIPKQGEVLGFGDASGTFGGNKAFGRSVRCVQED